MCFHSDIQAVQPTHQVGVVKGQLGHVDHVGLGALLVHSIFLVEVSDREWGSMVTVSRHVIELVVAGISAVVVVDLVRLRQRASCTYGCRSRRSISGCRCCRLLYCRRCFGRQAELLGLPPPRLQVLFDMIPKRFPRCGHGQTGMPGRALVEREFQTGLCDSDLWFKTFASSQKEIHP